MTGSEATRRRGYRREVSENNNIPGQITPDELRRLTASLAAAEPPGWGALLPGRQRQNWQRIRAAVQDFGNARARTAVRRYQLGLLRRFGDLKILAALHAALDDHAGFAACLRAYDRGLELADRGWTPEFAGQGQGAGSLDVYRILRAGDAACFEKIYARRSDCFRSMAFVHEHITPRLQGLRVPELREIVRGRRLAVARFELVEITETHQLDIDLAAETIVRLVATDLSGLDIPERLREFRRRDFRRCEARLHAHIARTWPEHAQTLREGLKTLEAEIRARPGVLCHGDLNRNNFSGHGHVLDWDAAGIFPRGYEAAYVAAIVTRKDGFDRLQRLYAEKFEPPDATAEDFRSFLFFVLHFLQKYAWREKTRRLQKRILQELGLLEERDMPRRKPDVDAYLAGLFETIDAHGIPDGRSVLLSGPERCGKSLTAAKLAETGGFFHVRADRLRDDLYGRLETPEGRRVMERLYREILLRYPRGVVLEGVDILDKAVPFARWAAGQGHPVVCLGCSGDDPQDKFHAMRRYREEGHCWTRKRLDEAQLRKLAARLVEKSRDNRALCAREGFAYFDIGANSFAQDSARTADAIAGFAGLPRAALDHRARPLDHEPEVRLSPARPRAT